MVRCSHYTVLLITASSMCSLEMVQSSWFGNTGLPPWYLVKRECKPPFGKILSIKNSKGINLLKKRRRMENRKIQRLWTTVHKPKVWLKSIWKNSDCDLKGKLRKFHFKDMKAILFWPVTDILGLSKILMSILWE